VVNIPSHEGAQCKVVPMFTHVHAKSSGQLGRLLHAMDVWLPYTNCGIATYPNRAIGMTGLSPARLRPCRPLHKTPVVTSTLAISRQGLLPSTSSIASAFPVHRIILTDHNYTFFEVQYRAYALDPVRLRTPIAGFALGLHY